MSPQQTTPNNVQDSASGSTFVPWPRDGRTASIRNSGLQSNMNDGSSPQVASEHRGSHNPSGPLGTMDVVVSNPSTPPTSSFSSSRSGYSHITWAAVSTPSSGEQLSLGTSSSSSSSLRKKQAATTVASGTSSKKSTNARKRQRADEDEDVVAENKEGRAPPRGRPRTTTTNGRSAKRRKETSAAASTLSHPTSQVTSASAPSSTAAINSAGTRRGATRSGAGRPTENPYPVIPSVHPTALPTATGLAVASRLAESGTETATLGSNWAPPPAAASHARVFTVGSTQQARVNPYPSPQLATVPAVGSADTTGPSAICVHSQACSSGTSLDLQVASKLADLPPVGPPSPALAHSHHQVQAQKQALNTYPAPPTTISTPMASTYPNPFDPVDLSGVPQENLVVFGRQAAKFLATYPGMRTRSVFSSADDMLQLHNQSPQVEPPRRPVINAAPRNQVRRNASGTAPDASLQDQP